MRAMSRKPHAVRDQRSYKSTILSSHLQPPKNSLTAPPEFPQHSPACTCDGGCPRCVPVQTKLKIGKPGDRYEQEADRIADRVMRMPDVEIRRSPLADQISPLVQRQIEPEEEEEEPLQAKYPDSGYIQRQDENPEEEEEEEEEVIQPKGRSGRSPGAPLDVRRSIRSLRGGGEPLAPGLCGFFEQRLGRNLSRVRIHDNGRAAEMAGAINARAFTVGKDIVFGAGQYAPETEQGKSLVAHELVHTMQQATDRLQRVQRKCTKPGLKAKDRLLYFPETKKLKKILAGKDILKRGEKGKDVKLIQQALVDMKYNLGKTGPLHNGVDGTFGNDTEKALWAFKILEMPVDVPDTDVVDASTLKCLDQERLMKGLEHRSKPQYFPHEKVLLKVFAGVKTLRKGTYEWDAVGLIQQALVDLGYDLGTTGPNKDGVDKQFKGLTEDAVKEFQTDYSLNVDAKDVGAIEKLTLRKLDAVRAKRTVTKAEEGIIPESQYRIEGLETKKVRDVDIYFHRGKSKLEDSEKKKITRLATKYRCKPLDLKGFMSEDERMDAGDKLALARIIKVDKQFQIAGHAHAVNCPSPERVKIPLPEASEGSYTYRKWRKVEVVPQHAKATTPRCSGAGALKPHRKFTKAEKPVVKKAIDKGIQLLKDTIHELKNRKSSLAKMALAKFFGGVNRRSVVKSKLEKWLKHMQGVVRKRIRRGTECEPNCKIALAFNRKHYSRAMITVCGSFFKSKIPLYPNVPIPIKRALGLIHEAGHGGLRTTDYAYDTYRLIHHIAKYWDLAKLNTDSFVTLIRHITGYLPGGTLPVIGDTIKNLTPQQRERALEGVAWLSSWLNWASQDASVLYKYLHKARTRGRWRSASTVRHWHGPLMKIFNIRRPKDAVPTMREQTAVAAISYRLREMHSSLSNKLTIEKDVTPGASTRWKTGSGYRPGSKIVLSGTYLSHAKVRPRVEILLPLIIAANPGIDILLQDAYEKYVKQVVKEDYKNEPKPSRK